VELTIEEARRLSDALKRSAEELERELGPLPATMDLQRAQEEVRVRGARARAEFEKVAVSALGEKGRVVAGQMRQQMEKTRRGQP
jgi:hypothetical protein